jgi:hypothetical protein
MGSNPASGRSNANEHFHEMVGSSGFWIYLTPNIPLTGYDRLREQLEARDCLITVAADAPVDLGANYPQLKVVSRTETLIPEDVLKLVHRWAHGRDFLHSFFKPAFPGLR